jgi:acyl carrier protein
MIDSRPGGWCASEVDEQGWEKLAMTDDEVLAIVREAVIWAKAEVVTLLPGQVEAGTVLSEPPIYLDSLEFVAMVTRLEEVLGLIAQDEHFSPSSMRTVGDLVAGVKSWVASEQVS